MPTRIPSPSPLARSLGVVARARGFLKTGVCCSGLLTSGDFESKLRLDWGFKAQESWFLEASVAEPEPSKAPSLTLESLATSLEHSLRSPMRAIERVCVFLSDRAFADRPPSNVKRTHQKEQRSYYE